MATGGNVVALDGTQHRAGCWYPKALREEKRYAERWPNHCGRCDGWGGFPFYDSDTGYNGYDPCPECLEAGKCPRCGAPILAEVEWDYGNVASCDTCGYVEGQSRGGQYVEEPCSCLERDRYIQGVGWVNGIGEAW